MEIYFTTEDTEGTEDEEEKIKTSVSSVSSVVKSKLSFKFRMFRFLGVKGSFIISFTLSAFLPKPLSPDKAVSQPLLCEGEGGESIIV